MGWEGLSPPYGTIVADPPWHYAEGFATAPGRRKPIKVPMPYSSMTVEDIAAMPVRDLVDRAAWGFLWTTNAYLPAAFGILEAWGFRYAQTLVWHKTGNPSPFGGSIAPNHAEFLLVGRLGEPPRLARIPSSVIAAGKPHDLHSQKPAVFADCIETCCGGPYVELFAREPRLGWDAWGLGYESDL